MKNRGLLTLIGLLCVVPMIVHADRGYCDRDCDQKLDALSKTLFRVDNDAFLVETSLNQYQTDCCESCANILRSILPWPQCTCEATPITGSISIATSGSYCLAQDITGFIITSPGVQVVIDLKGHTVNGSVALSDHGYVHNGTITQGLTLGSYSRAELVKVGGLLRGVGSDSQDVVVRDSVLTYPESTSFAISDFTSLTFDHCTLALEGELLPSIFNVQNVVNLIMRDCYVLGDLRIDLSFARILETLSIYDSHITGQLSVYPESSLSSITLWDSVINDFCLDLNIPFGAPSILLHGVTSSHIGFNAVQQHPDTRILVDECDGGRFVFQRVSNIRCQNSIANASPEGIYTAFAPIDLYDCQSAVFQDVMATNTLLDFVTLDPGFKISNCNDLLFKDCFSISENGTAFCVTPDGHSTSTNINFDGCIAKGSFTGFYSTERTSGSVINCSADGCGSIGFSQYTFDLPIVYASNIGCFNTYLNYYRLAGESPYYYADYTTTAGSWRNISL
jgi:hypothetical protein